MNLRRTKEVSETVGRTLLLQLQGTKLCPKEPTLSVKEGTKTSKGTQVSHAAVAQIFSLQDKISMLFLATKFMIFPYGGNEMLTVSNMKVRNIHSSGVEFLYARNKQYRRSK